MTPRRRRGRTGCARSPARDVPAMRVAARAIQSESQNPGKRSRLPLLSPGSQSLLSGLFQLLLMFLQVALQLPVALQLDGERVCVQRRLSQLVNGLAAVAALEGPTPRRPKISACCL